MSLIKRFLKELNIFSQCKELNVGLWSCPQFVFLVMGFVIIGTILLTYYIGQRYVDAQIIVLIVLLVTVFLLVMSFVIVRSFERIVYMRKQESERAKEILKLKDQFVFIAAHELRTPANAIKWGLEALESKHPDMIKKEEKYFDIIRRSNERLLFLVQDLLEVARIESKTIKIKLEGISMNEAFSGALEEIQELAGKKNITIDCDLGSGLPQVLGDSMRLKEIFINLLTNAIKYSRKKGKVIISSEEQDGEIIIHIADNGIGINPEDQRHIFEKFWRADEARKIEGTGLGLFITKQLVELMSGKIWFTSRVGEGTIFSMSFKEFKNHGEGITETAAIEKKEAEG